MKKILLAFLLMLPLVVSGVFPGGGTERIAASLSQTDIQAAFDAADAGDTITLPAGTNDTWDGETEITITKDDLIIQGAGEGVTILSTNNGTITSTNGMFNFSDCDGWTMEGITFDGQNSQAGAEIHIYILNCTDFRIFDCTFTDSSLACIYILGYPVDCVIHDNVFSNGFREGLGYAIDVLGEQDGETNGDKGDASWAAAINHGGQDCPYIEDNVFDTFRHYVANHHGARVVIRYNTITADSSESSGGDCFDTHGNGATGYSGNRGVRRMEIYQNTIDCTDGNPYVTNIDSGYVTIYDNTITGLTAQNYSFLAGSNACPNTPVYARPASTITDGGWTYNSGSLHGDTDEASSDSDTTYAEANAGDTYMELKFGTPSLADAVYGHTINVWAKTVGGGGNETITVDLYEGAVLMGNTLTAQAVDGTYTKYTGSVVWPDTDDISDWTDLRVRITPNNVTDAETLRVTMVELLIDAGPKPATDAGDIYLWGNLVNGGQYNDILEINSCDDDIGSPYFVEDTDWFNTERPDYTPLAYPHPSRGEAEPSPSKGVKGATSIISSGTIKEVVGASGYAIPSSYDMRDEGYVTAIRDQGASSSCTWFGVTGMFESILLQQLGLTVDMSEEAMKECSVISRGGAGASFMSAQAHMTKYGLPAEDDSADTVYVAGSSAPCPSDHGRWIPTQIVKVDNSDPDTIKQAILDYGGIFTTMDATFAYDGGTFAADYDGLACVIEDGPGTDHSVMIAGWDDGTWGGCTGYWIGRNSWGDTWGDSGYFYIDYDTNYFAKLMYQIREWQFLSPEDSLYGYDEGGFQTSKGYDTYDSAYGLCKYTASRDETIIGVGIHANQNGVDYEVGFYQSFDGTDLGAQIGETESGSCALRGYYTHWLTTPKVYGASDDIVVLVKYTTALGDLYTPVPCDDTDTDYCDIEDDKTYMSQDASSASWTDMNTESVDVAIPLFSTVDRAKISNATVSRGIIKESEQKEMK